MHPNGMVGNQCSSSIDLSLKPSHTHENKTLRIVTVVGAARCVLHKMGEPYDTFVDFDFWMFPIQHCLVLDDLIHGSLEHNGVHLATELNIDCHSLRADWRLNYIQNFIGEDKEAKMPDLQAAVNDFVIKLKRRQVEGSQASARETAVLLRSVISQQRVPRSNQAASLIGAVKSVGVQLIAANPVELAIGNIVRHVLHLIRDEDLALATTGVEALNVSVDSDDEDDTQHENPSQLSAAALAAANRSTLLAPSLHNLLESIPGPAIASRSSSGGDSEGKSKSVDKNSKSWKLKHGVIEAINELLEDIDNCRSQIAEQALEHIHQNEVILTLAHSRTVAQFLCEAKKKRSFQVFVAEGAPRYQGHALAKELVAKDLQTTVITDSAVFAMISRVNMVIAGAHAVLANGGVIAPIGLHMVALAAHRHAVPFVVLAGTHKLCPLYPHNPEVLLNDLKSPSELLDYGDFSDCMDGGTGNSRLRVVNPAFDYVPPQLVSLFITDTGGHNPSYMYRLIADYYSPADYVLQQPLEPQ